MKTKTSIILSLFAALAGVSVCGAELKVSINPEKTFQTVDNFAASDAWSGNFVGQYFGGAQRGQIAKWLFSEKLGRDGNPEGIGLSMWRVNVGGGSLEQDGADIEIYQRRAESFLTKDGKNYDWGKCAGQQYFMKMAKEYGCKKFLLFSNTPPVQMTRNGKGYGPGDFAANIKPECYGKFADFLADVAKHFQDEGYDISYISPVNEPQVDWKNTNKQEGSSWRASEICKIMRELDRALSERGLDNTKLFIGEPARVVYAYGSLPNVDKSWGKVSEDERPTHFLKKFADDSSPLYLLNLKHMDKYVGCHAYKTHETNEDLVSTRKLLKAACEKYGVGYQQTEWCLLPDSNQKTQWGLAEDWIDDNHADMQSSLVMGRIICADFAISDATGWGYWKGMEVNGNFALISVFPTDGNLHHGGAVRSNKMLWTLGNFSLFVRPSYKRVELSGADDYSKVVGVAFVSPCGKRIVAVFVNSSFETETARISLPEGAKVKDFSAFRTDSNMDMGNLRIARADSLVIAPRSVTTLVIDLQ